MHSWLRGYFVAPVCAATNTVRLRNYFRPSSPRHDKYSPPPQLFPQFSPRRDKYIPPPRPFPPLQSASRQIQSASATISAIQSAPRQIRSASATISAIQSAPRQIRSASATISAIQPINLVVVPKLYNTNYTLFSQIYFPTNTSPAPPSSITTLPHPFLHHYPLSDYFHPNLHSISFTRHAIFSPPPGPEAFSAQNDTSPVETSRTRCISCPK